MKIFHNPRCSKSRQTLQLLQEHGQNPDIVLYLKDNPTYKELEDILEALGMEAKDLIRKGEKVFKEEFKGKELSENKWIQAMVDYPVLIERPIVLHKKKAAIGRPPEKVLELL